MQVQREIGQRLREARQAAGMTQERAAAESGIDYKRYQRLEQGAVNATLRTLVRVATALRTDFWTLVGAEADQGEARSFVHSGLTAVHERGAQPRARHQVSVSRLVPADLARVVDALKKKRERARWLRGADPSLAGALAAGLADIDGLHVGEPGRARLRFTWDGADVDLTIAARPDGRAMIVVKNRGLVSAAQVEARRATWTRALEALRAYLAP